MILNPLKLWLVKEIKDRLPVQYRKKPELFNETQLQPAQLLLQGGKNNTPVVWAGSMTATTNQVGQPATFFWSSSTKRWQEKQKDKNKVCQPYLEG